MYNFTAKAPSIIEMEKPGKSMSPDNLYFDNVKANINKSNFLPELKITKRVSRNMSNLPSERTYESPLRVKNIEKTAELAILKIKENNMENKIY